MRLHAAKTYLPVGSGPLATGLGAFAGSYRLAASYLSSRSFGHLGTGALPPGPILTRVRRKPCPEPEVPLHRARDSEFKSPNCEQSEPSEPRETSQAQQIHTLPPQQKPPKKTGRHNAGTATAAPGPGKAEG